MYVRIIAPKYMKLLLNNSTPVEILSVGDRHRTVTSTEKQNPYGLPTPSTEIIMNLQKKLSDDQVETFTELRSEKKIVRVDKFIRIAP